MRRCERHPSVKEGLSIPSCDWMHSTYLKELASPCRLLSRVIATAIWLKLLKPNRNLVYTVIDCVVMKLLYIQSELYAIARPPVRLSQRWISQKRLKLRSCNFHLALVLRDIFRPEMLTGFPERWVKQGWVEENKLFSIGVCISVTKRYMRLKLLLITNRKLHNAISIGNKIESITLDDLELFYKLEFSGTFARFCRFGHIWEATTAKWMKIDPYCLRQNCIH